MKFPVHHMNACKDDIKGNHGIGRYFFVTGSDARAKQISEQFENRVENLHPRQHNLYMGQIRTASGELIDVASIASGMGGPSADIIINELVILGAKRFIRVGTAGSLHPEHINVDDIVVATGAVRDDKASWDYIYPEYPAMASFEYVHASKKAVSKGLFNDRRVHFGVVHSKSSLFAREFQFSLLDESPQYMNALRKAGVMATEMECAQFFTLAPVLSARNGHAFSDKDKIMCGAVLAIIGDESGFCKDDNRIVLTINAAIECAIASTLEMYEMDKMFW